MSDEFQVFTFRFNGKIELLSYPPKPVAPESTDEGANSGKSESAGTAAAKESILDKTLATLDKALAPLKGYVSGATSSEDQYTSKIVSKLNHVSDNIAQQIELEIQKHLQPFMTVQADLKFDKGSILISGTILIFSWAGSVALKAAREEFEEQFSEVIKVSIRRVFSRVLGGEQELASILGPVDVKVTPVIKRTKEKSTTTSQTEAEVGRFFNKSITRPGVNWYLVTLIMVLLIQLILIADRFVTIGVKR